MRRGWGRRMRLPLLVLGGLASLLALRALAVTLIVDQTGGGSFSAIQPAIDAAAPGDDVFVRCGTYAENVVMKEGVSLRGAGAPCTTIDGGRHGTVVRIPAMQGTVELSGFTLRGGNTALGPPSSVGYGVEILGGTPVISRNVIEGNIPGGVTASVGAGVALAPTIVNNVLVGNGPCCYGGGIVLSGQSDAVVASNLLAGNVSDYGGGIFVAGKALIAQNTIVQNVAHAYGGGVWADGVSTAAPTLHGNVIVGNRSTASGGGVFSWLSPAVRFSENDVVSNLPDNYFAANGYDPTGHDNNVSVDPLFVDERVSFLGFALRSSSPLLDFGMVPPFPYPELERDLAGLPRALDGDADGLGKPDLGARENDGPTRLLATQADGLSWDPVMRPGIGYEAFRGDLDVLRETGVYTQDPVSVPGARQFCALAVPSLSDTDVPVPGQALFYLAAARGTVAGTLGFTSAGSERPRTMPCVSP